VANRYISTGVLQPVQNLTRLPLQDIARNQAMYDFDKQEVPDESMPEEPLPFMATARDQYDNPYYGDGFDGWARKTFAKVLGEDNFYYDKNNQKNQRAFEAAANHWENRLDAIGWSKWGEKIFGITAEEIARSKGASVAAAEEAQQKTPDDEAAGLKEINAQTVGIFARATQEGLWTALSLIGGTSDYIQRLGFANRLAEDEVADLAGWANPLESDNWAVKAFNFVNLGMTRGAIDELRIASAVLTGKVGLQEGIERKFEAQKRYSAGAEAVYTMYSNELARENYNRLVEDGMDEGLAARNISNPFTELAGSLFLDLASWLGTPIFKLGKARIIIPVVGDVVEIGHTLLSRPAVNLSKLVIGKITGKAPRYLRSLQDMGIIVGQTPTFAKIAGISLGAERLKKLGDQAGAMDELIKTAKNTNPANAPQVAIRVMEKVVKNTDNYLQPFRVKTGKEKLLQPFQILFSLDAPGRAKSLGRTVNPILATLIANGSRDMDEAMALFQDGIKLARGGEDALEAAARLVNHNNAEVILSPNGLQSMYILSKMDEMEEIAGLTDVLTDKSQLLPKLMERYGDLMSELSPSMDEMSEAARIVKRGGLTKLDAGKITEIIPPTPKQERLAEMWNKSTDPLIRWSRKATAIAEKANAPFVKFMGTVFMDVAAAGFYARNIMGSTIQMANLFGFEAALETGTKALGGLSENMTIKILDRNAKEMESILGFVHEAARRGYEEVTVFGKEPGLLDPIRFSQKARRSEEIMSSELALRSIKRTMRQALDIPAMWKGLEEVDREAAQVVKQFARENGGNLNLALNKYRSLKGSVQAQQLLTLPPRLERTLEDMHAAEEFYRLRDGNLTPQEFKKAWNEAYQKIVDTAEELAKKEPAGIGDAVLGSEAAEVTEHLTREDADLFIRNRQAWQNVTNTLDKAKETVDMHIGSLPLSPQQRNLYQGEIEKVRVAFNNRMEQKNQLLQTVRDINRDSRRFDNAKAVEWWKALSNIQLSNGKTSIAEMFPALDPSRMTRKDFVNALWTFYGEASSNHWFNTNERQYAGYMNIWNKFLTDAGSSLDDIARPKSGQATTLFEELQKHVAEARQYDTVLKEGGGAMQKLLREVPPETTLDMWNMPASLKFPGGKQRLFSSVNADRVAAGFQPAGTMNDVPFSEWSKTLAKRTRQAVPPPLHGAVPSAAQIIHRERDLIKTDFEAVNLAYENAYGKTIGVGELADEAAVGKWKEFAEGNLTALRASAARIATAERDFILHSYDKTYIERGLAMLSPFRYWTDHTKINMFEAFAANPRMLTAYMAYRRYVEKEHAGLPDFYRYNIPISGIFGIDRDNPIYLNLEQNMNPLNTITGTDFNDPYKRADWLSRIVDDLGKNGATATLPIQWLVALNLFRKGETDAGQRWVGRLFPQMRMLKGAITRAQVIAAGGDYSKVQPFNAGPVIINNELDPFVNWFSGGLDPYEANRVGRSMAVMVQEQIGDMERNAKLAELRITQDRTLTKAEKDQLILEVRMQLEQEKGTLQAQAIEQAEAQEGDLWRTATVRGIDQRFAGDAMSFFLGQGFKRRGKGDVEIDNFYQEYHRFRTIAPFMSPDQVAAGYNTLRQKYPFMDTVLLAKRSGPDRETAYSYNVLGRIPPGATTEFYAAAGINRETIQRFYDDKGDMSGWEESERERFLAGVADLGAFLAVPSDGTRQEWTEAKGTYQDMKAYIQERFGEDIYDQIDRYYQSDNRDAFLQANPAVEQALDMQNQVVISNPLLNEYYGGFDVVERFYTNKMYDRLEGRYGNIQAVFDEYYELQIKDALYGTKEARAYKKAHPEMTEYSKEKSGLQTQLNRFLAGYQLPETMLPVARLDFAPRTPSQASLASLGQAQAVISWEQWQQVLSPAMQSLIRDYYRNGDDLPSAAEKQLDYIAGQFGMSGDDALLMIGRSLQNQ